MDGPADERTLAFGALFERCWFCGENEADGPPRLVEIDREHHRSLLGEMASRKIEATVHHLPVPRCRRCHGAHTESGDLRSCLFGVLALIAVAIACAAVSRRPWEIALVSAVVGLTVFGYTESRSQTAATRTLGIRPPNDAFDFLAMIRDRGDEDLARELASHFTRERSIDTRGAVRAIQALNRLR